MALDYFEFDYSENASGGGSWDAMASVAPARLPAALHEAEAILQWCCAEFGSPDPTDSELAHWSFDLQLSQGDTDDLQARFNLESAAIAARAAQAGGARCTLTLTLSGSAAFSQALAEHFKLS